MAKYETIDGRLVPHTKQGRPTKGVTFPTCCPVDPGDTRKQEAPAAPGAPGSDIEGEGLAEAANLTAGTRKPGPGNDPEPSSPSPICALDGCDKPTKPKKKGRKPKYCSAKCRNRAKKKGGKRVRRRGT